MKHKYYKELLQLLVYGEINEEEEVLLNNHLSECSECGKELESLKKIFSALVENPPQMPDDKVLNAARMKLLRQVSEEKSISRISEKFFEPVKSFLFGRYKFAFGGIATILLGIFIGYLFFAPGRAAIQSIPANQEIDVDNIEERGLNITNIRFPNPFSDEGEIEVNFDAIKPISYKGKAEDKFIQQLLATALLTANNPGRRIQTLNTIASQAERNILPDVKVKKALINTIKADENPGVRREALNVLMRYPYDDEIRDAFLFVLSHDSNSGIRVAAINALSNLKLSGRAIDDETKNILNNRIETDDNEFIRLRAASLLKGEN